VRFHPLPLCSLKRFNSDDCAEFNPVAQLYSFPASWSFGHFKLFSGPVALPATYSKIRKVLHSTAV
jgi:hypothetical protein